VDDAAYHRHSVIVLLVTCAVLGALGFVSVQVGRPALASLAEISQEVLWSWRLLAPLVLYAMAAAVFGWVCGWVAERRGVFSPLTCAAMPVAVLLVTAGLCLITGNAPPFAWGLTLLSYAAMVISGLFRWKLGELV